MSSTTGHPRSLAAILGVTGRIVLPCLLVVLLVGCASPSPPDTGGRPPEAALAEGSEPTADDPTPIPEPAPSATSPTVRCFYGDTLQRTPDGTETPGAELLLRRQVEPAASRIVEDSVRYDGASGKVHHYRVVMEVDAEAGTFTLRETNDLYAGTGRLEGEPWDWTAWSLTYRLTSGIAVEGRSAVRAGEDGHPVLYGEKQAYGPDGTLALNLVETLPELDPEACQERFAQAVEGDPPGAP